VNDVIALHGLDSGQFNTAQRKSGEVRGA